MWTDRTQLLIGKDGLKKLQNSHVAVIGLGGVGGYACSLLARAGIGHFTIVDFDVVDETNTNRQIVADTQTVGKFKTEVMAEMISKINPNCKVEVLNLRLTAENLQNGKINLKNCDYVVDAIDSVKDKVELICHCKENIIPIVSAMGSGNRIEIPEFKVVDIYKTSNDGLAKVMRKNLRNRSIKNLDVVTTTQTPMQTDSNTVGSISYFPAMCGCVLAGFVIQRLLKHSEMKT